MNNIDKFRQKLNEHSEALKAEQQARDQITKHLQGAEGIIRNILVKKKVRSPSDDDLPEELQWINRFRRRDAQFKFIPGGHVELTIDDPSKRGQWGYKPSTYRIDKVFIQGDTWQIAKKTRQLLARHQQSQDYQQFRVAKEKHDKAAEQARLAQEEMASAQAQYEKTVRRNEKYTKR